MARWFKGSFWCWRATPSEEETEPSCSFCGRPRSWVKKLVQGGWPNPAFICDECVAVMTDMLASEDPAWAEERVKALELRQAGKVEHGASN